MAQVPIIATSSLSQIVRRKRKAAFAYDDKENEVNETSVVPRKLQCTCDNNAFLRCSSEDFKRKNFIGV